MAAVVKRMFCFLTELVIGFLWGVVLLLNYGSLGLLIGATIAGAIAIWRIVGWVNRRDDPQYAIRPSDFS